MLETKFKLAFLVAVLFFPSQGQTCHAYCTYCFRWPQFVGLDQFKFASRETQKLVAYLKDHPEVTSVLITGGDPLIMKTQVLRRYIEPLLAPELDHLVHLHRPLGQHDHHGHIEAEDRLDITGHAQAIGPIAGLP